MTSRGITTGRAAASIPIEARKPPQWTWYLPIEVSPRGFVALLELRRALKQERDSLMNLPEPNLAAAMGGRRAAFVPLYRVRVVEPNGALTEYLCTLISVQQGVLTMGRSILDRRRAPNGAEDWSWQPENEPRARHLWPAAGTTVIVEDLPVPEPAPSE